MTVAAAGHSVARSMNSMPESWMGIEAYINDEKPWLCNMRMADTAVRCCACAGHRLEVVTVGYESSVPLS